LSGATDRRRGRLEGLLTDSSIEAMIVTHLPNVRYLTGFAGSSGVLFLSPAGAPVLITDFRYEEQAQEEVDAPVRVRVVADGWLPAVADVVAERRTSTVGFEAEHLSVAEHVRVSDRLSGSECVPTHHLVERLRITKDDDEIARIERAARAAEAALERLLESVDWTAEPSERSVSAALMSELTNAGSERPPFDLIVAAGSRSSLPHATPSDRPIRRGDLLLLDFGATVEGYCSDITRTFSVGRAEPWQRRIHGRVLEAQRLAIERIAAGVDASAVDRSARDALISGDLAKHFGHSTGHGIGLAIHEDPRLSTRSDHVLEAGNVVTVEPGVYLPGRGGVRIEDDVLVTDRGSRTLTRFPRELIEL